MAKAKDLRDHTVEELEAMYLDWRKELFAIRNEVQITKKLEKPHALHQKKKDIARLLTVIGEKQRASV